MRRDYLSAAGDAADACRVHDYGPMARAGILKKPWPMPRRPHAGQAGYPDALVTQTQEILKGAELARERNFQPAPGRGVSLLKTAIEQGKQGKVDAATQTVESALTHLSESATPASGYSGY